MMLYSAKRDLNKCIQCSACSEIVACPGGEVGNIQSCVGCKACYLACPAEAIELVPRSPKDFVRIFVDGENHQVPSHVTIKQALEFIGYSFGKFPKDAQIFAPCDVGGCYCCAVMVNDQTKPSCITKVFEGMKVLTQLPEDYVPKRCLHGWMGHPVGGVGTPWWIKSPDRYIEAAVFACGCNFRCKTCQNWTTTYCGKEVALSPKEAAIIMTETRKRCSVDRMAISGGEPSLNRSWLLKYFKELRKLNPDPKARIHLDTNGSILTGDYIDELVEAGMTDVGIDLKGLKLETFMKITGVNDAELAQKYHSTAWKAVKYILEQYSEKVFLGIGIPYNPELISLEEVFKMGDEICKLDPEVQVCVLDYRPEFRKTDISRPSYLEMKKVWNLLKGCGLKTVICQTAYGYIGP